MMKKFLFLLIIFPLFAVAEDKPAVVGVGVDSCREYLFVREGWEQGQAEQIARHLQYREWLSGMTTGLSLATAEDVLRGVDIQGALRRIKLYCEEKPDDDFFTASMDLIRSLSTLR